MQMFGYGSIMPTYACLHLFTSSAAASTAAAIRPRSLAPIDLEAMVPAFGLGYFALSCLYAFPFPSGTLHQWLGAVWQGFPLHVVGWQHLFSKLLPRHSYSAPPAARSWSRDYRALSDAYDFAFNVGAVAQLSVYGVLAAVRLAPSLFSRALADTLTLTDVFVPGPFHSYRKMDSMGCAMHTMFLYDQYAGSAAALICQFLVSLSASFREPVSVAGAVCLWASQLHDRANTDSCSVGAVSLFVTSKQQSLTTGAAARLAWDIFRWVLLAGPAGALVRVVQLRDRTLLMDDGKQA